MDKENVRYIYIYKISFSHKKMENLPFVTTWVDPDDIMLSEINQTEKDKCNVISLIHGIF